MQIQVATGTCMLGLQRAWLHWEWRPCRWRMVTTWFRLIKWLLKLKRAKMTRGRGVLCLWKKKILHRILPRRHELTTPCWTSLVFSMKIYLIVKQLDRHFGEMLCFFVIEPMPSLSQSSSDVQLSLRNWEQQCSREASVKMPKLRGWGRQNFCLWGSCYSINLFLRTATYGREKVLLRIFMQRCVFLSQRERSFGNCSSESSL